MWLTLVDCVKFEKCTNHHLQEGWLVLLTCLRLASNSADFPAAISHPEFNLLMKLEAAKPRRAHFHGTLTLHLYKTQFQPASGTVISML